jgi:hypothetical protein
MRLEYGVQILLLVWAVYNYRFLARNRLLSVIYLLIVLIVLDIAVKHSVAWGFISVVHILEMLLIVFSVLLYPALKTEKLTLIIPILFITTLIDTLQRYYASIGWYNLFTFNYFYISCAPLFYILFLDALQLKGWRAKIYLVIAAVSEFFFLFEYVDHDNRQINYITSTIFYLQHIIISGLIIGRLAMRESHVAISREPFFWICTGRLIFSVVEVVMAGVHPFLTRYFIEIYTSRFMTFLEPLAGLVLAICYCYAFFLCGQRWHDRISIRVIRKELKNIF